MYMLIYIPFLITLLFHYVKILSHPLGILPPKLFLQCPLSQGKASPFTWLPKPELWHHPVSSLYLMLTNSYQAQAFPLAEMALKSRQLTSRPSRHILRDPPVLTLVHSKAFSFKAEWFFRKCKWHRTTPRTNILQTFLMPVGWRSKKSLTFPPRSQSSTPFSCRQSSATLDLLEFLERVHTELSPQVKYTFSSLLFLTNSN